MLIRVCYFCKELQNVNEKLEKMIEEYKEHAQQTNQFLPETTTLCTKCQAIFFLKLKHTRLGDHRCLKNCGFGTGISAKAMEPLGTCLLCKDRPKYDMRVCGICMDDDTTTKAQLQKNTRPTSSGTMSKDLAVKKFYTNPSHRGETITTVYILFLIVKRQNSWISIFLTGLQN